MTASSSALSFIDVGKCFGNTWIVEHLDLHVDPGTVLGLIGPSGSGKTTTMRLANGVYRPDAGEVRLLGGAPSEMSPADRTRLGYLPQTPVLFDELSIWSNLDFHASINGVRHRGRKRWMQYLLDLVELGGHEKKLAREASGGMRRRLALAASLVHEPRILMLDEPTAGIDPILRNRLWDEFRRLADDGRTLIVNTQYVGEAASCDLIGLLAEGKLIALGHPEQLRRDACGGDVLELEVHRAVDDEVCQRLGAEAGAINSERVGLQRMRFLVEDGGAALPHLLSRLEAHGLRSVDTEEIVMSYDDMFVALVERARAGATS